MSDFDFPSDPSSVNLPPIEGLRKWWSRKGFSSGLGFEDKKELSLRSAFIQCPFSGRKGEDERSSVNKEKLDGK